MTQEHPITPPPELVKQWLGTYFGATVTGEVSDVELALVNQAARWGADEELKACCLWVAQESRAACRQLKAHRRPKSPSLKEQALAKLPEHPENMASHLKLTPGEVATIRRALESLPS